MHTWLFLIGTLRNFAVQTWSDTSFSPVRKRLRVRSWFSTTAVTMARCYCKSAAVSQKLRAWFWAVQAFSMSSQILCSCSSISDCDHTARTTLTNSEHELFLTADTPKTMCHYVSLTDRLNGWILVDKPCRWSEPPINVSVDHDGELEQFLCERAVVPSELNSLGEFITTAS